MINHTTEVIFFDKASPSTLEIDDWKILTQGGYTACDVQNREIIHQQMSNDLNSTAKAAVYSRRSARNG